MNDWPADPKLDAGLQRLVDAELAAARADAIGPSARRVVRPGRNGAAFAGLAILAAIAIVASLALRGANTTKPATGGPSASDGGVTSTKPTPTPTSQPSFIPITPADTIRPIQPVVSTTPSPWFRATGAPNHPYDSATLLLDGSVLFAGGFDPEVPGFLSTAELYDPATGKFTPTGSMVTGRVDETATRLLDGRVLFVGGLVTSQTPNSETSSAEIYDPKTGTFSPTGSMGEARQFHTATLLRDGKVLITGGFDVNRPAAPMAFHPGAERQTIRGAMTKERGSMASAELYDPKTGTFTPTGSMTEARDGHTAALLPDGRVLVFGNAPGDGDPTDTSAEVYDPKTGTFTVTGSTVVARASAHATPLADGLILITDGSTDGVKAEIYNPKTGKFSVTGELKVARSSFSATLLFDGRVLIAGGDGVKAGNATSSAELYDPKTGAFTLAGSMTAARSGPVATLLADGQVLIAEGEYIISKGSVLVRSAELYQP